MTTYRIIAKREIWYEFPIEANSKEEAIQEMNRIEFAEDAEEYAYDFYPLEIQEIQGE